MLVPLPGLNGVQVGWRASFGVRGSDEGVELGQVPHEYLVLDVQLVSRARLVGL